MTVDTKATERNSIAMRTYFSSMALNNRWANRTLYRACSNLSDEEIKAERASFFGSINATLQHILEVDLYYLGALEGLPAREIDKAVGSLASVKDLAAAQENADNRLLAFCRGITPDRLNESVSTNRGEHGIVPERIDALLLHLFQHQVHHRGQVHAMLSATSVAPPQLDEFFLDFDRASDAEGPEFRP